MNLQALRGCKGTCAVTTFVFLNFLMDTFNMNL
uniref:Uncharacterized protein n=1 Tax=Lepeophtheirus salmonis TaxID=72036 RepID=A0A0K2UEQ6_LEPSM